MEDSNRFIVRLAVGAVSGHGGRWRQLRTARLSPVRSRVISPRVGPCLPEPADLRWRVRLTGSLWSRYESVDLDQRCTGCQVPGLMEGSISR